MKLVRRYLILCLCFSLLSGCSYKKIRSLPIYKNSTKIIKMINHSKWEKAAVEAKRMECLFEDNKWKYQLLGDETEYSGLNQEISRLQVSIEARDPREAKTNIKMIQDFIESIYFR